MAGNARVNQVIEEALGTPTGSSNARANQVIEEVLGTPAGSANVRVNQVIVEVLGTPFTFTGPLTFTGNQDGLFYSTPQIVPQLVPVPYDVLGTNLNNTMVTVSGGASGGSQQLTQDGGWVPWSPGSGKLTIKFTDGYPVRSVWVYPTGTSTMEVWASSSPHRPTIDLT